MQVTTEPPDADEIVAARRPRFPGAADGLLPPTDRDLTRVWRVVSALVVAASCVTVLWALNLPLLLRDTTPNGGDLGAHVWFPAYLSDHLLPDLRVAGWSNDWFGGFPAGQFYFPVPALVTVLLDVFLPYNVALKLTTALGPVLMPLGAYTFARGLRVRRPGPELFAVATLFFLFFHGIAALPNTADATIQFNQRIMGGPLVSALAGEYSFSLALALALFTMGAVAVAVRTGRRVSLAALLLAATILSHVVVGIFAGVGAVVIVVATLTLPSIRARSVLGRAVAIALVGTLLTAFWSFPLLRAFDFSASMRYERLTQYVDYLFLDQFTWLYVLAAVGLAIGIATFDRAILSVAVMAVAFALIFRFWPEAKAWNLRFLPFWYLMVILLAAAGTSEVLRRVGGLVARFVVGPLPDATETLGDDLARERRTYRVSLTAVVLSATVVLGAAGIWFNWDHKAFIPDWAAWNETGYEYAARPNDPNWKADRRKQYGEYKALVDEMRTLPPGRAMWEGGPSLDAYGTPLALMLLPYWTDGRIGSLEGLYYESAASTPYVFMAVAPLSASGNASNPVRALQYRTLADFSIGVEYLRALGGRYYLAHSPEAKTAADGDPGLRFVASTPDVDGAEPSGWSIYEVRDHALVAPLRFEPVVVAPHAASQRECFGLDTPDPGPTLGDWECIAAGWWNAADRLDRPLAASGPDSWRRATVQEAAELPGRALPPVEVTGIRETENDISFDVDRVGVPVVVRTSYFPNWSADGARGPWRLSPNLMVVVPTERHVRLHFERSGVEKVGAALSVVGLAGTVGLVVWERRRRRERVAPPEPIGA